MNKIYSNKNLCKFDNKYLNNNLYCLYKEKKIIVYIDIF